MGWKAPRVTQAHTWQPETKKRQNACKGAAAYLVINQAMETGPVKLETVGAVWLAAQLEGTPINAIAKQLANRAGRPVAQTADQLAFA